MTTEQPKQKKRVKDLVLSFATIRDVVVAGVSALAVLGGQWGVASINSSSDLTREMLTSLQEENGTLREIVTALQDEKLEWGAERSRMSIRIAAMEQALQGNFDIIELLCTFLEAEPGINWAKQVDASGDEVQFIMACIDGEFRSEFSIQPFEYLGETDRSVWSEEDAAGFYAIDYKVYSTRRPEIVEETWTTRRGERQTRTVTKYYFAYDFGDETLEFVIGHIN